MTARDLAPTISDVQRRTYYGILGMPDRDGWAATITYPAGDTTIFVSRLDGETEWTADALFGPGSYPVFCHGFGERTTVARAACDDLIIAALDAAVDVLDDNERFWEIAARHDRTDA